MRVVVVEGCTEEAMVGDVSCGCLVPRWSGRGGEGEAILWRRRVEARAVSRAVWGGCSAQGGSQEDGADPVVERKTW